MTLGIHREAPPFADQSTAQEILVTGIKVLAPHAAVPEYGLGPMHAIISSSAMYMQASGMPFCVPFG